MKKIILALMISVMFAGAGFCAPPSNMPHKGHVAKSVVAPPHDIHHKKHGKHDMAPPPPPPPVYTYTAIRRHKHHIPIYPYDYYPGTQVIVNTGGISIGYDTAYGGYVNYGGYFRY